MMIERTANLLGALALALTDAMRAETEARAAHAAAAPAALVTIGHAPGESIDTLARILGLSHSATVRLVDRLVSDGLVERRSGADGRTTAIHATPLGLARRAAILGGRHTVLASVLEILSGDERAALTSIIEKLLSGLTTDRQQADHICRLCDEPVCPAETCPVECSVTPDDGSAR